MVNGLTKMRYIVMLIGGSVITYFITAMSETDPIITKPISKYKGFIGIIVTVIIMIALFLIFDL